MDKRTLLKLILLHRGKTVRWFAEERCGVSETFLGMVFRGDRGSAHVDAQVTLYIRDNIQSLGLAVAQEIPAYRRYRQAA